MFCRSSKCWPKIGINEIKLVIFIFVSSPEQSVFDTECLKYNSSTESNYPDWPGWLATVNSTGQFYEFLHLNSFQIFLVQTGNWISRCQLLYYHSIREKNEAFCGSGKIYFKQGSIYICSKSASRFTLALLVIGFLNV